MLTPFATPLLLKPMPQPVFLAPDHDHGRCTADALAHAEALCAQRAQRLTPIRRRVLACTEQALLDTWIRRAAVASSAADVVGAADS